MAVVGTAVFELVAETARFRTDMARATSQVQNSTGSIERATRGAVRALRTLGVALGAREVIQYADTWRLLEGRLRLVTTSSSNLARVQSSLFDIAQRSRTSFESTAELYARVARNADALGRSQDELLRFTEATQKAVQLSGATAQEASAGVIQLSQGLAAGALRGDEFRSVSEQLPGILIAIQQATGKTAGELREMAFAGELTADVVIDSMLKMGDTIDEQFQNIPQTVGQAFVVLRNEVLKFVGGADNATDASANLARAIVGVSQNLDGVVRAGGAVLTILGARWIRTFAAARLAMVATTAAATGMTFGMSAATLAARGLWTAIGGPIGAVLLGIYAAANAMHVFRRRTDEAKRSAEELQGQLGGLAAALDFQSRKEAEAAQTAAQATARATRARIEALEAQREVARGLDRLGISRDERLKAREVVDALTRSIEEQRAALAGQEAVADAATQALYRFDRGARGAVGASDDVRDAIEELTVALRSADILTNLLGDAFDGNDARADAYRSAIEALAEAGVSLDAVVGPQGETFRELVDRYLDLSASIKQANEAEKESVRLKSEAESLARSLATAEETRTAALEEAKILLDGSARGQELYNRAIERANVEYARTLPASQALTEAFARQREVLTSLVAPTQQLGERMAFLFLLFQTGAISAPQFAEQLSEAMKGATESVTNLATPLQALQDQLANTFLRGADAAADFATGAKDALKSFVQSALRDLARLLARMLAIRALGFLIPGAAPALEAAAGFATRAHGGPVRQGQPYLVGERGPELFVPASSGNIVANGAMGGTLRFDPSSLPPRPRAMTPDAVATDDWWRRAFSHLKLDYDARGGL